MIVRASAVTLLIIWKLINGTLGGLGERVHGKWCVKDICQFIIQHKRQHHPFFKNLTVTYQEAIEDVYKDFLDRMAWKKEDLVPTPKVEARGTKLNMDEGVNVKHGRKPGGGVDSRGEKNAGSLSDKEVRRRRWLAAHRREQRDRESVRKARENLRRLERDCKSHMTTPVRCT
mmetsp:Transcript_59095/g.113996  ORF Transcript_59095/g.113996 Transcript_59095/m.113996 type:complete len:173 (+) Transcript_59095:876-1394(+)